MVYDSDVAVQSVSFRPDGIVELTYAEQRDVGDSITLVKTLMFTEDSASDEVSIVLDGLRELVDVVLQVQREDRIKIAGR